MKRPRIPSPDELQQQVDSWNAMVPVGTPVNVRMDDGSIRQLKTTSKAWLMGGHSAVILLDGIYGGFSLARCAPALTPRAERE